MLIVFIDALPASKGFEFSKLKTSKLIPNLGYSVNLHNELFNGKTPDQMGFFGEYLYNEDVKPSKEYLFKALNLIEYLPFKLNYLFKIFLRKFFRVRIGQIPFKYVPYFNRKGKYPFIKECNSMLDSFKTFITDDLQNGLGNRDEVALKGVFSYLKQGNDLNKDIFISLCDLDGIGHKFGTMSPEYNQRLDYLSENVENVMNVYEEIFPNEPMVVLSDHGMSNVESYVDPRSVIKEIEKKYNSKVFYDSLYIQVFINSVNDITKDVESISNLLSASLPVKVFNEEERKMYGVTNKTFGNVLGVLNDRLAFSPNLFGYLKMKAYHGYLPNSDDNKGIFLHKNLIEGNLEEINSIEVYKLFNGIQKA
ncbi:alkaline phosphatase family protein [Tenacibaculum sp. MEBiC06402]|uniref:alkaline phosphatase family protein n=1 Tax=unclassified Tenacibaculum TaxID=2635139 RepID=UPI003B9AD999